MNLFSTIVHDIEAFFANPKVKGAIHEAGVLSKQAAPIVAKIASLTPNKTVQEIAAVYAKYGVPVGFALSESDPNAVGNALLNLATAELGKIAPGVPTSILNTAVQLAVTAVKAGA